MKANRMRSLLRWLALAYGLSTTLLFAATAIYAVGFIANLGLPKTIDSGPAGPTAHALPINVLLIALFAVQHSLMARQGFKRVWARIVPPPVERSTYVLCACLCLLLLFWLWQPMPAIVWSVEQPLLRLALHATFWSGWMLVLIAAMLTNSLELVGLRQIWNWCAGRAAGELSLTTTGLYRFVRHPIYVGTFVGFWATPDMTVGHLFFAITATAYTVFGTFLEERDLVRTFGDRYRTYQRKVRMLLPIPK